jgi:hypothetical protein
MENLYIHHNNKNSDTETKSESASYDSFELRGVVFTIKLKYSS